MRGANCSTDHILIKTKSRLKVRRLMRKNNQRPRKLNVRKLKQDATRNEFAANATEKLGNLTGSVEEKWTEFSSNLYEVAKDTIGIEKRKHADWFDENDEELSRLLKERNEARAEMLNRNTRSMKAKYKRCAQLLQKRCRELKNGWWQAKAAELQEKADMNDTRGFYQGLKAVWGQLS